ncbi:MAG: Exodeoxyribonuclease V gamma chain [uncultured Solirubrobacteraceae bacterium]|uniref:RecBCD enzyme subunit RecC n=1 Tax=uncultured Solirubrobacteraceae bacterium TaxID=1162706 RepID=A0A6J4RJX7_9ACTN|nr:MAG: Exodeoxyribonuclease V gamma chain [uncultured Solirubrobacteraceae bacterium]
MLHIHRAERADGLVRALAALLAEPLGDPFSTEVICVPTRGMERWLTQRLSGTLGATPGRRDGVCANVDFPFPRTLARDAVAVAAGVDPDADPWLPERAVWPLLEVVGERLHEPWLRSLSVHLGEEDDAARRARRFATVRHLADLFDAYALHRPEMVRGWARDEVDLPADAVWQARLWQALRRRLGEASPAERVQAACDRIVAEPGLLDLPGRIALFGLTRLPRGHLDILGALSAGRDVHLFLLHPSAALWESVARHPPVVRRYDDDTALLPENRLLASWGQDAREMQLVLSAHRHVDHHHPVENGGESLLARLQADVRSDSSPPGAPLPGHADARPALDPADHSVRIHACHGRARQVEVLRDAILHLLAEDETLEPRDVIVMCPDIETFAPLIQATFGAGDVLADEELEAPAPGVALPDLRVRLADRSLRQTNPVLGVVAQLIDLAGRRLTASEVLDLADREPVRRRFSFDDEDLARMRDWVASSGIRWGLDAGHRAPYKLGDLDAGTWRAGLDRMLVGVTMTEEGHRLFGGVLPADDVESVAIDLVGRMAEFVDRLHATVDAFGASRPIGSWVEAIAAAADALTATSQRDAWQRAQLQRILDAVESEAAGAADVELTLPEIRALLAERLQGRPTRANFRTGHLTICTLVPMRSIPHRVVCLLGLDDAAFPRKAPRDGDDLMLADSHVGERDPRFEDRQMLLDALMVAGNRLIVTYTGNDVRTNAPRPPAVPIGELLDMVERTAGGDARRRILVRHPLQPFDVRNFTAGELDGEPPWSFDRVTLDGARATAEERVDPRPFLSAPLPAVTGPVVELDDLVAFVRHPVRAFVRQRLGFGVGTHSDEVDDALSVELDKLEQWQIGERMLTARLAGASIEAAEAAERARGELPPGKLSDPVLAEIRPSVEEVFAQASRLLPAAAAPASVDVRVGLPGGRMLTGTVPGVYGDLLRSVTYSRVNPRHRLVAWVRFLALTAAYPERPIEAATVGRAAFGAGHDAVATVVRLPRLDPAVALEHLAELVALHDEGMREPLPISCMTSAAYARAVSAGGDARKAAAKEWKTEWNFPREDQDPEHQLVFGGILAFEELCARAAFDSLARRLWEAALGWEQVEHR